MGTVQPYFDLKQNERKGDDLAKWIQSPEVAKIAHSAEGIAWESFEARFPRADKSKFVTQTNFAQDHTAKAEIFTKREMAVLKASWVQTADAGVQE